MTNSNSPSDPTKWVELYGDQLYRYAFSRLRKVHAAEEVVQETFLAAWRFREQFVGNGAERAWFLAILRRKIVDYARMRVRIEQREFHWQSDKWVESLFDDSGRLNADLVFVDVDPAKIAQDREVWKDLRTSLDKLPQTQATAFVLRELEGLSADEICQALDISKSNLWVLLHRARLRLARHLIQHRGTSPPPSSSSDPPA